MERVSAPVLEESHGWWTHIVAADFDGDEDYMIGNWGLNSRLKALDDEPVTMHVGDLGRDGYAEQMSRSTRTARSTSARLLSKRSLRPYTASRPAITTVMAT